MAKKLRNKRHEITTLKTKERKRAGRTSKGGSYLVDFILGVVEVVFSSIFSSSKD